MAQPTRKNLPVEGGMYYDSTDNKWKAWNQKTIISAIEAVSGLQRATDLEGGGLTTVGTTAVAVAFTGTPTESIIITYPAIAANTGQMYIGNSDVTNLGANAVAVLLPGQSITLDYDDSTNGIYAVSDTASQTILSGAAL